jgi:MFS family permease
MPFLSRQARTLLAISFLTTFAEAMLVPIYSAFTEKVGGSILDAGIAFAVFSMSTGVVVGLIGTRHWFEARLGRFLLLGFCLSAACDFSYMLVQDKWQLFAVQLVAGLATGFIEPAWDALFTEGMVESPAKHWSIWAGGVHVVTGAAALVGGLIVSYHSFNALFVAMGLLDGLAIYVTWAGDVLPRTNAPSDREGSTLPLEP